MPMFYNELYPELYSSYMPAPMIYNELFARCMFELRTQRTDTCKCVPWPTGLERGQHHPEQADPETNLGDLMLRKLLKTYMFSTCRSP